MRAYDITISTQDLTYLTWDENTRPSGFFVPEPTAREGVGAAAVLYRLNSDESQTFYEPQAGTGGASELIACRLMDALDIPHVDTRLIHAHVHIDGKDATRWVTRYKNLRAPGARQMPIDLFFELSAHAEETPLSMCSRMGWDIPIAHMLVVDYLTANRERTAAAISVQSDPQGRYSLTALTGGRHALTSSFIGQTWRMNACADISTKNYLGSSSLEENLRWAIKTLKSQGCLLTCKHEKAAKGSTESKPLPCEHLTERTRRELFRSLGDVFPPMTSQQEGSWQIIRRRWERYAHLCRL